MPFPSNRKNLKNKNRQARTLGVENLEARMMFSISEIESNLLALSQSQHLGSTQLVSNTTNSAPTIAQSPSISVSGNVTGTSVNAQVRGADDRGEQNLRYTWQVVSQPANASARFSANDSNAAKSTTINFNAAGHYTFRVVIRDAQGASVSSNTLQVNVVQTLRRISLQSPAGSTSIIGSTHTVSGTSTSLSAVAFDQFGNAMQTTPSFTWSLSRISGSNPNVVISGNNASIGFDRAGSYTLTVRSGSLNLSTRLNVTETPTAINLINNGQQANSSTPINVNRTTHTLQLVSVDQFNQRLKSQPNAVWTSLSSPTGARPRISGSSASATFTFDRAGAYTFRVVAGNLSRTVTFNVVQQLTRLTASSSATTILANQTAQLQVTGTDQFNHAMGIMPAITWTSSIGTINNAGLFNPNGTAGNAVITARSESTTATVNISVVAVQTPGGNTGQTSVQNAALQNLLQTIYVDNSISRNEMIQLLRSAGADGVVDATELADLRFIVSSSSNYTMPSFVRELAKDVVNSNPANLRFRGQDAGNLVAGSSAQLLYNLVDKWFLGADEPILVGAGIAYRAATGNLFNGNPSSNDMKQGQLGDCYFIAAVGAIADRTPDAIRNLFIDNGDGTFTVRFYAGALGQFFSNGTLSAGFLSGSGTADYVTVNRRLPTYANGMLAYSGAGQLATSPSTTLWIALLEKAYAQWNETGNSGRNGTNTYAGIEGGWMSNVNAPILGYNSTNHVLSTAAKQSLTNALANGLAVTIGTSGSATFGGLVGSHAYVITGYNSATDTFTLRNPWGFAHPIDLTWEQLRANCTMFTVTGTGGTSAISTASVRSEPVWYAAFTSQFVTPSLLGTVDVDECASNFIKNQSKALEVSLPQMHASADELQTGLASSDHANWITLDDEPQEQPTASAMSLLLAETKLDVEIANF